MLSENLKYNIPPHPELVIDCRKAQKKRSIVEDTLCEYVFIVVEYAYLR